MSVVIRLEGYEEARAAHSPKIARSAARMAINEAAKTGRTVAARLIVERWNVKKNKVNAELKNAIQATNARLEAVIVAKGRPISLSYYGFKGVSRAISSGGRGTQRKRNKEGKKTGRYQVMRGVSGSVLRGTKVTYPRAFVATMSSGFTGVFMNEADFFGRDYEYRTPRRGMYAGRKGRSGIVSLATITLPSMMQQGRVYEPTRKAILDRLTERFYYHLARLREMAK